MAARKDPNINTEINESRSRLLLNRWDMAQVDIDIRLNKLTNLATSTNDEDYFRHIVVASVATLQTFHRSIIATIIELDVAYKKRAVAHLSDKISPKDALNWFTSNDFSFGEIVAHSASCNSVNDLMSWLRTLLDCDLKLELATAVSPEDRRNNVTNPNKLVLNVDDLLSSLANCFKLRHIFAHEAASQSSINSDECNTCLEAVKLWIKAVKAILWNTAYKNHPFTQREIENKASDEIKLAEKALAISMCKALKYASGNGQASWIVKNHLEWKRGLKEFLDKTYGSMGGTFWRAQYGFEKARAIRNRNELILNWNNVRGR